MLGVLSGLEPHVRNSLTAYSMTGRLPNIWANKTRDPGGNGETFKGIWGDFKVIFKGEIEEIFPRLHQLEKKGRHLWHRDLSQGL
jgi:hypothetical protein